MKKIWDHIGHLLLREEANGNFRLTRIGVIVGVIACPFVIAVTILAHPKLFAAAVARTWRKP